MLELLGEEDGKESQCPAETSSSVGQAEDHGPMLMNIDYEAPGPSIVGRTVLTATVAFVGLVIGWITWAFG